MNRLAAVMVLVAASLGVAGPALAGDKPHPDTTHRAVCHPTGKGWTLINPSQASSHIDERTGAPKHEHSGRVDVYAVAGVCPSVPSPTSTGSPTSTPTITQPTSTPSTDTHTTQTTGPSQSQTSSTPTRSATTTTSSPSKVPTTAPSSPSVASVEPSRTTGTSPRRSVPSSTVAPPERLARTGFEAALVVLAAGLLGLGVVFTRLARKGAHR